MGGNAGHSTIQILASGLPRANSSGPVRCPRLQLRGSAGFAPASQSSLSKEDARTNFLKHRECTCWQGESQIFFREGPLATQTRRRSGIKSSCGLFSVALCLCGEYGLLWRVKMPFGRRMWP